MERLRTHPLDPQPRHIARAAQALRSGGLVVIPTDTTYALVCDIFAKRAIDDIYRIKKLPENHPLAILCPDLSEVARYASIDNRAFGILKRQLPGKFTFVLPAQSLVPRLLTRGSKSSKRTVGIRIPQSPICSALLRELGHPMVSTTVNREMRLADDPQTDAAVEGDPDAIQRDLMRSVDVFLDVGELFGEPSSVVDLIASPPQILRQGSGDLSWLER